MEGTANGKEKLKIKTFNFGAIIDPF